MPRTLQNIAMLFSAFLVFSASAADTELKIHDPYVRLAPPGAQATGAFMLIKNAGTIDRKLVKAESTAAKAVELHTHINENGVMKMREIPNIDIKAGGQTELKPGSYHVMLIGMQRMLQEGEKISLTLRFDDGSHQQIEVPVRKIQPSGMSHGEMKH